MLIVAFMTLMQRRSPQAIMGRVSTAVEVVMAVPQAISLALGSAARGDARATARSS